MINRNGYLNEKASEAERPDTCGTHGLISASLPLRRNQAILHHDTHACDNCGREFRTREAMEKHAKVHDRISESEMESQTEVKTEIEEHFCKKCGKSFSRYCKLLIHIMNNHDEAETYTREKTQENMVAAKNFMPKTDLRQILPIKIEKQEQEKYSCDEDGRLYECPTCSKRFATKATLQRHSSIHTGEKPYFCAVCTKALRCSYSMNAHVKIHSEVQDRGCKNCGKAFDPQHHISKNRKAHINKRLEPNSRSKKIMTRSPYTCATCSKTFSSKYKLQRHFLVHTEERLFNCTICEMKFKRKDSLLRHIRTHTGTKRRASFA